MPWQEFLCHTHRPFTFQCFLNYLLLLNFLLSFIHLPVTFHCTHNIFFFHIFSFPYAYQPNSIFHLSSFFFFDSSLPFPSSIYQHWPSLISVPPPSRVLPVHSGLLLNVCYYTFLVYFNVLFQEEYAGSNRATIFVT